MAKRAATARTQTSPALRLSATQLKVIACITMAIDHSAILGPDYPTRYLMKCIGRIAFPIFIFLIAEGCAKTHDRQRYVLRLAAGALVSQIPWIIFQRFELHMYFSTNVFVTLALAALSTYGVDELHKRPLLGIAVIAGCYGATQLLHSDWKTVGVLVCAALYGLRAFPPRYARIGQLCIIALTWLWLGQPTGLFALIPLALYSGKRGGECMGELAKWGFYAFYPLHLLVIVAVGTFL